MLLSTPGLILHTTPYAESSVVVKVFTRQLGTRSYIVKGVRGRGGRVKQNLLQPLSSVDMVVYDNPKNDLNYIKEIAPRHPLRTQGAVDNALRFFMTEVLYKVLREEEPMPALFDYADACSSEVEAATDHPLLFMLTVAGHLGIEPLDNHGSSTPLFDLQEGRFVALPTETTLPPALSTMLHTYLLALHAQALPAFRPADRRMLLDALLAYFQLHLPGFRDFHSHEILHTILR